MSEIRLSLKRMLMRMDRIFPKDVEFLALKKLEEKAKELEKEIIGRDITFPSNMSVKLVLKKINDGKGLSRKECKELPFVMVDEKCNKSLLLKCLSYVDVSRERILKRYILVYFMKYGQMDKDRRKIYCAIINKRLNDTEYKPKGEFMHKMKHYSRVIFSENCTKNVSRMIDRLGLQEVTLELKLPEMIRYSDLIIESIKDYFGEMLPIAKKIETLKELENLGDSKKYFYRAIPQIAENLIIAVNKDVRGNKYKKDCIDFFYEELGDPRISGRLLVRWNEVSEESRKIFLSWLAEKDLNLFFEIIAKTAVDHMWTSRKKFWSSYLPYITNTWVLFGKSAMEIAHQIEDKKITFGKLKGGLTDHSVFAFQIGRFMFVEWSHSGKLRVWDADDAPDIFGYEIIRKEDITWSDNILEEWVHSGNTNNKWQRDVDIWIQKNCGINKA